MSRYIKKFSLIGSAGPTEERGFAIWAGYDIAGIDNDLSYAGLTNVDGWSDEMLREHGILKFTRIEAGDVVMHEKLGIKRNA